MMRASRPYPDAKPRFPPIGANPAPGRVPAESYIFLYIVFIVVIVY